MSEINYEYKKMHPFKWFILENFPFLEDSIDTLTNYQLFCKLGEEINKNRDSINEIGENESEVVTAFNNLYDYVHDYFDNLNVQDEINQKLDEMTTSGQLTYIIKNYVDSVLNPYTENLTEDVNNFKDSVNTQLETTNQNVSTNANNITTLSSRMDTFSNLQQGSTTGDAELADGRISYSGLTYPNIGDSIRGQVNLLFNNMDLQNVELEKNQFDGIYIQGLYKSADGTFDSTRVDYISTKNKILIGSATRYQIQSRPDGINTVYVMYYQSDDTFISAITYPLNNPVVKFPANTNYIRISLKNSSQATNKPTDYMPLILKFNYFDNTTKQILKDTLNVNGIQYYNFTNNIYYVSDGAIGKVNNRIGLTYQVQTTQDVDISVDDGYLISYVTFSQFDGVPVKDHQISGSNWVQSVTFSKGTIFTLNMKKSDESAITPADAIHFHVKPKYPNIDLGNDYAIDSSFIKKNISATLQGSMTGYQSFCMYNGNIYCTDGTHIYVYNSSYVLQNTVEINVGHGNAMQLTENGICYISGWNDNTIYKVDLNTISIVDTIVLPNTITGLTTCCVDDLNKIVYIFNASVATSGSAQEHYNFIKYDYENETILSSRKIHKFSAMQSCDLIDGVILAINGLGTEVNPNGFRIYDTEGSVIGEYVINSHSTEEPEGCFIDRDTKDVYISFGTSVYKIS